MKTFTIENDTNNIILYASGKEAELVPDSERFNSEAALAKLAANWPAARIVDIWNSLPGATPVKKFKDRSTAVSRIWKAVQTLGQTASVTEESTPLPEVAPAAELLETAPVPQAADTELSAEALFPEPEASETIQPEAVMPESTEPVVATLFTPQTPDVAPEAAPAKTKATSAKKVLTAATTPGAPREGSKTSQVIAMLKREGGATLDEIMTAMGWQKHTTRAMLSAGGSLTKNHGLTVVSEKVGDERRYSIKG